MKFTPNTFISQPRYKDIRTFLLGTSILKINNLGMNVFESAVVPTLIFIGSKSEPFEQFIYIDSSKNSKFDSLIDKDETSLIKRQDIESSKDISFLNFKSTHKLTFDDVFEIKSESDLVLLKQSLAAAKAFELKKQQNL